MEFTADKKEFSDAIAFVNSAAPTTTPMPIISNIKASCSESGVTFTATDLEIEKQASIIANVVSVGETTVTAKKLNMIAIQASKTNKEKPIKFKLNAKKEGKREQVLMTSGRSRWVMATLPAREFPSFDTPDSNIKIDVDTGDLADAMKQCQYAMAQQDVRYYLNGMLMDMKGGHLSVVSTDGQRLSKSDVNVSTEIERQAIIPRKPVGEIIKMLSSSDSATIELGKDSVKISADNRVIQSKLIDGKFPDYNRVIPQSSTIEATVNRTELIESVACVMPLANEKYKGMRFVFDGNTVTVQGNNPETEESVDEIGADVVGGTVEIGFNGDFVRDALSQIGDSNVTLKMSDSNAAARIDSGNYTAVLMPMRL